MVYNQDLESNVEKGLYYKQRWYNHLDPNINKKEWTIEEERIIF